MAKFVRSRQHLFANEWPHDVWQCRKINLLPIVPLVIKPNRGKSPPAQKKSLSFRKHLWHVLRLKCKYFAQKLEWLVCGYCIWGFFLTAMELRKEVILSVHLMVTDVVGSFSSEASQRTTAKRIFSRYCESLPSVPKCCEILCWSRFIWSSWWMGIFFLGLTSSFVFHDFDINKIIWDLFAIWVTSVGRGADVQMVF